MYENKTYEEIKNLPEEQKAEAWREIHSIYPENKALAEKLGIAHIAVVNAVKKYVLNEPIGRANKKEKQEPAQEQIEIKPEAQQEQQVEKPKRKYIRKAKQETVIELPKNKPESLGNEVSNYPKINIVVSSFLININNSFSGEHAQIMLNGIGSTLLKDHEYNIEIKISEK